MASTGPTDPAPTASASLSSQPDNVSLRIITLAHGGNRDTDLYLVVHLDTKVGQLKTRLQENLTNRPSPDTQRLIYQGRPLLDHEATLRSILRLQPPASTPTSVHVLHLVIRQDGTSTTNTSSTSRPQPVQTPQPAPRLNNTTPTPQSGPLPIPHNPGQQAFPGLGTAQMMMQNQLSAIQQHMAAHNQHMAQTQGGVPGAHLGHMSHFPGVPRPPTSGQPANPHSPHPHIHHNIPGIEVPGTPGSQTSSMTTRIQESVGSNGERIRTVINSSGPILQSQLRSHINPMETSAPAPGSVQSQQSVGPNMNAGLPIHQNPIPGFPMSFGRSMVNPFGLQSAPQPRPASPTVWLLSSPTGPQALVLAPGHGYLSTIPASQPNQATASETTASANINLPSQPPQPTPTQPALPDQTTPNAADQPRAQIVLRPQEQAQAQAAARPQNREGEDLLAFVLQRGWLFIRLYMFIFVLSESGTWRRIIMLAGAVFVCLLPRQNPLTEGFNAARRHVDNLIGPPQAPQRDARAQGDQNRTGIADNTDGSTNATNQRSSSRQMPTPEEHARRLLRDRQTQNPSFIRGLIHSVEQAVALFLASLIPGVGERHVRAREEARRVVQEAEEEQRRRREAETRGDSQVQASSEGQQQPSTTDGSNTIVEKRDEPGATSSAVESETSRAAMGTSSAIDTSTSAPDASSSSSTGVRQRVVDSSTTAPGTGAS